MVLISLGVLQIVSGLLQVDTATLTSALLFRTIQTGGTGQSNRSSTYNVPQNAGQVNSSITRNEINM